MLPQGFDPGDGQPVFHPCVMALAGQRERPVEQRDNVPRDLQPGGRRGRVGISAGGIGDRDHPYGIGVRRRGGEVEPGRFDTAGHPAKEIHLIADFDADIESPILAPGTGRYRTFRKPRIICAPTDVGLRQAIGPRAAQTSTGTGYPGNRLADVGIGTQRVLDEAVEHRVVIETPPFGGQRCRRHGLRLCRKIGAGRRRGERGNDDIRPRRASRQGKRGKGGECEIFFDHGKTYSAGSAAGAARLWGELGLRRIPASRSPSERQTT